MRKSAAAICDARAPLRGRRRDARRDRHRGGAADRKKPASTRDVDDLLRNALARVSVKDAVGEVALATGRPRREVYQRALELAKDDGDGARVDAAAAQAAAAARQKREARPKESRPFGLGLSAESRAAAWLIAQRLSHSGAALEKPARRDRHHRARAATC